MKETITATELTRVYFEAIRNVAETALTPNDNPAPWDTPEVALNVISEYCGALASLLEAIPSTDSELSYHLIDFEESFNEGVEMMDWRLENELNGKTFEVEC